VVMVGNMRRIDVAQIFNIKESELKEFCENDPFNEGNIIHGYLSIRATHVYGALCIFEVNGKPTEPQIIYGTPKLLYPFSNNDGDRIYRWPRFKYISVFDKLDGCLDAKTILETEDGPKTIQDVCETQYKGLIKTFDIDDQKIIFDKIVNYSVQENNDDWYEIILENGQKIKLTGNHKVWLPELMCYRSVKDLKGNEKILIL